MAKSSITIKFSDESREALERFTAAVTDMQERASALLPTLCDDGQHVWTAEVCSLVEECAQCMTTRHKSGLDPEPTSDPCPCGCRRDVEPPSIESIPGDPAPEPETVTVTLPRDVVDLALGRLDKAACWAGDDGQAAAARGHMEAWRALADALDAASATQSERAL